MRERMSRIVRRERRFHESCKKLFIAFEFWLKSRHGIYRQAAAAWARRARVTESIRTFRLSLSAKIFTARARSNRCSHVTGVLFVVCLHGFSPSRKTVCINEMVRLSRLFRLPHDEERNCQMNKLMFKQWMRNIWTKFQIGCCRRAEKRGCWSTTQSRRGRRRTQMRIPQDVNMFEQDNEMLKLRFETFHCFALFWIICKLAVTVVVCSLWKRASKYPPKTTWFKYISWVRVTRNGESSKNPGWFCQRTSQPSWRNVAQSLDFSAKKDTWVENWLLLRVELRSSSFDQQECKM